MWQFGSCRDAVTLKGWKQLLELQTPELHNTHPYLAPGTHARVLAIGFRV